MLYYIYMLKIIMRCVKIGVLCLSVLFLGCFNDDLIVERIIPADGSIHRPFGIGLLPTPDRQILLTEQYCRNLVVIKDDAVVKKIPIVIPNRRISITHHRADEITLFP